MLLFQEIRQIAGRAGRFGSIYETGEVTCLTNDDVTRVQQALDTNEVTIRKAGTIFINDKLQYLII